LQNKKGGRSGCAYRLSPEGDLYLRAVAPRLLGEGAQGLPFNRTAFGRLLPELLGDALNGEHILQRDNIVRHCAAPHVDARKIANGPYEDRDTRIKVASVPQRLSVQAAPAHRS
jgi:hypothetical protein